MLNILGQSRSLSQLQRAMRTNRLAHTWIFAGPPGVGKFRLAVELAKTQLCDHPQFRPNAELAEHALPQLPPDFPIRLPCGVCESCRAVDSENHPDLHIITKELIRFHDKGGKSKGTTLSIHVIRGEIIGSDDENHRVEPKIYKRPFRGRGKWFIIDEADLMEIPAQNALLKTLEEPPAESYLVLITTSPNDLLSTIRSRSQIVLLNELPTEVILPALIGRGLSNEDARLLARLAHGSLGRAVGWADDLATIAQKNEAAAARKSKNADKDKDDQENTPHAFNPDGILGWLRLLTDVLDALVARRAAASDVAALLNDLANEYAELQLLRDPLTSKDRATRDGIALLLGICADWFADRLRQGLAAPHPLSLPAATSGLDPTQARELINAARAAESQIDSNANVNLLLAATTTQWEKHLHAPSPT